MTFKHTPGPWRVDGNAIIGIFEDEEAQVAAMFRTTWMRPDDPGKNRRFRALERGDAVLIAAAPQLLQMCKDVVSEVEDGVFADLVPSTIHALVSDYIKPLIKTIEEKAG